MPALKMFLTMVKESKWQVLLLWLSLASCLEQMEQYAPELIDLLLELVATGHVELLGETYAHSFSFVV